MKSSNRVSCRATCLLTLAFLLGCGLTTRAAADVIESVDTAAAFPSSADFQTFNPHDPATPTGAERTLTLTRNLTQTFQLDEPITIDEIDLMYVRGITGATGRLRIFDVADATALDITNDFNDAVANGFLLDVEFTMPETDATEQTLRLDLTDLDQITLPALEGSAGYALNLTSPNQTEVLTWRFGDPGTGSGVGWYADGRVFYDDFISSGSTEIRRDALFALVNVPEPSSALLAVGGGAALLLRRRRPRQSA